MEAITGELLTTAGLLLDVLGVIIIGSNALHSKQQATKLSYPQDPDVRTVNVPDGFTARYPDGIASDATAVRIDTRLLAQFHRLGWTHFGTALRQLPSH